MSQEEVLQYLGYGVLILIGLLLIKNLFYTQRKMIETFIGDSSNLSELITSSEFPNLKSAVQQQEDVLRVDKYRTKYEDMLIDFDEYLNGVILQKLVQNTSKIGDGNLSKEDEMNAVVSELNSLYTLKQNLNSTMTYIDSKK